MQNSSQSPNEKEIRGSLIEFRDKQPEIITEAVRRSLKFNTEVTQHGDQASALIKSGLEFSLKAVDMAMDLGDIQMLAHQIPWGLDRLPHDGVTHEHVLHRFKILQDCISDLLTTPHAEIVNQYIQFLIDEQIKGMKADE